MKRRLPPLNSLRAFEAAARHLSFTHAAEELSVTPAAVSQQVKALEEYFGVELFKRLTRALVLTSSGQMILPLLTEGFDRLADADRLLRDRQDQNMITVSVAPALGLWLLPRLARFRQFAPHYDIRVDASEMEVDFSRENVDLALRFGTGNYAGLATECLFNERITVVCSPDLLTGKQPLNTPNDLRHHTLLHSVWHSQDAARVDWRMWLQVMGVKDIDAERGPRFNLASMVIQAAVQGQGLALVDESMATEEIAQGRLIKPFATPDALSEVSAGLCYYLVYPQDRQNDPKVLCFREWLYSELALEPENGE